MLCSEIVNPTAANISPELLIRVRKKTYVALQAISSFRRIMRLNQFVQPGGASRGKERVERGFRLPPASPCSLLPGPTALNSFAEKNLETNFKPAFRLYGFINYIKMNNLHSEV